MLDYWTTGERDYAEEEWQRREYEAEALAELEHERTCDGTCDYCAAVTDLRARREH
jgi:hypothetical protein